MAGDFYDALVKLDRDIANRWKRATNGELSHGISFIEAKTIFEPVFRVKKITENQAAVLSFIVVFGKFEAEVRDYVLSGLRLADERGAFERGAGKKLVTDAELAQFRAALQWSNIANINFVSPGSRIAYNPLHYEAIKELVRAGNISVIEVRVAGLNLLTSGTKAYYKSDPNILRVYAGLSPNDFANAVVHEATHAIQDWRDAKVLNVHAEADAFVAGGVCEHILGDSSSTKKGNPFFDKAFKAAKFVFEGKAAADNVSWIGAYQDLVANIENDPAYAGFREKMKTWKRGEGSIEKDRFTALIGKILIDDAYKGTLGTPLNFLKKFMQ